MSVHRSFKLIGRMKRHRSVLSRLERVRILQEKGSLDPGQGSVLGLPKVRHLKIQIRKAKAAAPAGAGAAGAPAGPSAPALGSGHRGPAAAAPAETGKIKKRPG